MAELNSGSVDLQIIDFVKICRTCLGFDGKVRRLFTNPDTEEAMEIRKKIEEITNYPIIKDDNLPNNICEKCVENAEVAFQFKTQCERAFEVLSSVVESYQNQSKENSIAISPDLIVLHRAESITDLTQSGDEDEFRCNDCNKTFTQEVHLRKHMAAIHPNSEEMCKKCNKNFGSPTRLNKHIALCKGVGAEIENRTEAKEKPRCTECNEEFQTALDVVKHVCKSEKEQNALQGQKGIVNDGKSRCTDCDEEFETALDVAKHVCKGEYVKSKGNQKSNEPSSEGDNHPLFNFDDNTSSTFGETHEKENDPDTQDIQSEGQNGNSNDFDIDPDEDDSINQHETENGSDDSSDDKPLLELRNATAGKNGKSKNDGRKRKRGRKPKDKSENKCMICDKTFSRGTHLRRHMLTHSQEKPFTCKECNKAFARADHLRMHMRKHGVKPFVCELCGRGFVRQEILTQHEELRHSGGTSKAKTVFCQICNKGFTTSKYLSIHMRIHTDRKWKCKYCPETFDTKALSTQHSKTHVHEKPFLCSICGLQFVRNDYLVIHMRRHKGEKPYKCKFCGKGFPRATDLNVHERYHTGEKSHLCTVCGKGFQRAYNLLVHMRVHTGERPYKCPHCRKSFAQGNDLKSHIRRHTGERIKCDICDVGFIQGYHLTQHKRNVHGIEIESNIRRVEKFVTPVEQIQQMEALRRKVVDEPKPKIIDEMESEPTEEQKFEIELMYTEIKIEDSFSSNDIDEPTREEEEHLDMLYEENKSEQEISNGEED